MVKALGSKHEALSKGQYTYRMVIAKGTGDGEQTSMEIIANQAELHQCAQLGYNILDIRMFEQNIRYLNSMKVLEELPPDVRMKVLRCIETAFGRVPVEDMLPPAATELRRVEKEPESGEAQG